MATRQATLYDDTAGIVASAATPPRLALAGYWLGAAAFVLIAAVIFLLSTRHGIGILPDSTRYMSLGVKPYDAPLYPWLLRAVAAAGLTVAQAAKLAGLGLACLNAWLVWHILTRVTGRLGYAAVGTALIVLSAQFVLLHSVAMSEPLFIATMLAGLLALLRFWATGQRGWLLACGVAIGLAALTRFTSPPLGAAIALTLLLDPRRQLRARLGDAAIVGVVSGAIFLSWAGLSELVAGHSTGRPLHLYGGVNDKSWSAAINALTVWLAPHQVPLVIRATLFLVAFGACCWLAARYGQRILRDARTAPAGAAMLPITLGLFFVLYLAFVALATMIEANLQLNTRYAFPIYVTSVMMMVIILADARSAAGGGRHLHKALLGLAIVMLMGHVLRSADYTHRVYRTGIGYASLAWTRSPVLGAVRALPAGAAIYSNGPDVIAYVLQRPALNIPAHVLPRTGRDDPAHPYVQQIGDVRTALEHGDAYLVFLDRVDWRFYMASEAELTRQLDLVLVDHEADGRIYTARRRGTE